MPFEKCPHCRERVRPPQMELHLKHCLIKRRKDKIASLVGIPIEPIVPPILPRGKKEKKGKEK